MSNLIKLISFTICLQKVNIGLEVEFDIQKSLREWMFVLDAAAAGAACAMLVQCAFKF